ncbi:MAG: hypothetical protein ABGZ17_11795 [Planctomycetaceae bacterium]
MAAPSSFECAEQESPQRMRGLSIINRLYPMLNAADAVWDGQQSRVTVTAELRTDSRVKSLGCGASAPVNRNRQAGCGLIFYGRSVGGCIGDAVQAFVSQGPDTATSVAEFVVSDSERSNTDT